jgi:hypothetical protein
MKRLLWLGAGLAIGALVVRAVTKKAQAYTPRGIAVGVRDSSRNLLDSVRDFVDDVRDGMHEREQELREAFAEGRALDDLGDLGDFDDFDVLAEDDGADADRHLPEGTTR